MRQLTRKPEEDKTKEGEEEKHTQGAGASSAGIEDRKLKARKATLLRRIKELENNYPGADGNFYAHDDELEKCKRMLKEVEAKLDPVFYKELYPAGDFGDAQVA
jgi:hypothetical protein